MFISGKVWTFELLFCYMNNLEIERKFFLTLEAPDVQGALEGKNPVVEERYYLYRADGIELRFTKLTKGTETFCNFDRMSLIRASEQSSHIVRTKDRLKITLAEFERLLALLKLEDPNVLPIVRWSYHIGDAPKFEIKVYKNRHEGLVRAEVEFESESAAQAFSPLAWFGAEITDSLVGIDTQLPDLSQSEFLKILDSLREKV